MARGLVDRITVATRAQGVLYDRTATADIGPIAAADARRAIEAGRSTSAMTSREGRAGVRELVVAAARVWAACGARIASASAVSLARRG